MSLIKIIVFTLCFFMSSVSLAEDKAVLKVVTDTWLNTTNKDGTGFFFDLLRAIFTPKNIGLDIHYVPYSRALVMLSQGDADVILGTYSGEYDSGWYGRYPVGMDIVDVAVTKEIFENWRGVETLKDKRVATTFGYSTDEFINISGHYGEVRTENAMIKMLAAGRVDAIIGYSKDFIPLWNDLNVDRQIYIKKGVFKYPIYFVFYDAPVPNQYREIFDAGMKRLIESGELKEMFDKDIGNMDYYPTYNKIK